MQAFSVSSPGLDAFTDCDIERKTVLTAVNLILLKTASVSAWSVRMSIYSADNVSAIVMLFLLDVSTDLHCDLPD